MHLDPTDPLLQPYRDLRSTRENLSVEGRPAFICEGRKLVRMALEEARASGIPHEELRTLFDLLLEQDHD